MLDQVLAARNDKAALDEAASGTLDEEEFFLVQAGYPYLSEPTWKRLLQTMA